MSDEDTVQDEQDEAAVAAEPPSELESKPAETSAGIAQVNLDLLLDVQVNLSVEVGRARLPIKDLLALNEGAVVPLDREVNDPLDLMVNGTLIARGEVVENHGRFGLRLIEVVSPGERLKNLK